MFQGLKRDPKLVGAAVIRAGDTYVATQPLQVLFPERYAEHHLAQVGNEKFVLGVFAVILPGRAYAVQRAITQVQMAPANIRTIYVDDQPYTLFEFDPGNEVICNTNVVVDDTLPYYVSREMGEQGKIPAFLKHRDLALLFESTPRLCGVKQGSNEAVTSMMFSSVSRDPEDLTVAYANCIDSWEQEDTKPFRVVPLSDVQYGTSNTTSKLMGANSDPALTSALVNESPTSEPIEELLRL